MFFLFHTLWHCNWLRLSITVFDVTDSSSQLTGKLNTYAVLAFGTLLFTTQTAHSKYNVDCIFFFLEKYHCSYFQLHSWMCLTMLCLILDIKMAQESQSLSGVVKRKKVTWENLKINATYSVAYSNMYCMVCILYLYISMHYVYVRRITYVWLYCACTYKEMYHI